MFTRGVRGATTVDENTKEAIEKASVELVKQMVEQNEIKSEDISSVLYTMTKDLNADFPAKFARITFGWDCVPMFCAQEMEVPGSLQKCIRVLMSVNTDKKQSEINHVYLNNAEQLRPDLSKK